MCVGLVAAEEPRGQHSAEGAAANNDIVKESCVRTSARIHAAVRLIQAIADVATKNVEAKISSWRIWVGWHCGLLGFLVRLISWSPVSLLSSIPSSPL